MTITIRAFVLLFIVGFSFSSCKGKVQEPEIKLKRIPIEEIVDRVKADNFDLSTARYRLIDGSPLTDTTRQMLNEGKLGKEYFVDENNIIKEIRVRSLKHEDIIVEIQRMAYDSKPFEGMTKMTIDCSLQEAFYKEVQRSIDEPSSDKSTRRSVIIRNVQAVVSSLKQCGWPENYINTVWEVMQNAPVAVMAYYYADFVQFAVDSKINISKVAVLEDKLLMSYGYPQEYGTQLVDGHLYKVSDTMTIDLKRASMGLVPIQKFLDYWDLDKTVEFELMSNGSDDQ